MDDGNDGKQATPSFGVDSLSYTYMSSDQGRSRRATNGSSKHSLSSIIDRFSTAELPDLTLGRGGSGGRHRSISKEGTGTTGNQTPTRGGIHRGTKDYPHLKNGEKQERAERKGLVRTDSRSDSDDDGGGRFLGGKELDGGEGDGDLSIQDLESTPKLGMTRTFGNTPR